MNKWKRVYAVAAGLLALSVIGMIVTAGTKDLFWLLPAVVSALVCIFARIKIGRKD